MDGKEKKPVRGASPELHQLAREMRENPTPAEAALWAALSGKKMGRLKFRFQHPIGQFILDFYCASCKLALELDGGVHDARVEEDAARSEQLEAYGYRVIRFRNEEVLTDIATVLAQISDVANGSPPRPQFWGGPDEE